MLIKEYDRQYLSQIGQSYFNLSKDQSDNYCSYNSDDILSAGLQNSLLIELENELAAYKTKENIKCLNGELEQEQLQN
jgi:hypothetical protein